MKRADDTHKMKLNSLQMGLYSIEWNVSQCIDLYEWQRMKDFQFSCAT